MKALRVKRKSAAKRLGHKHKLTMLSGEPFSGTVDSRWLSCEQHNPHANWSVQFLAKMVKEHADWFEIEKKGVETMRVMSKSNVRKLRKRFPWLKKTGALGTPPFLAVQEGWFQLVWDLYEKIDAELAADPGMAANFTVDQIKQKFGTLRWYFSGGNETIKQAVSGAEVKSGTICEVCGKRGRLRGDLLFVQTLCDSDYEDYLIPQRFKRAKLRIMRRVEKNNPQVEKFKRAEEVKRSG